MGNSKEDLIKLRELIDKFGVDIALLIGEMLPFDGDMAYAGNLGKQIGEIQGLIWLMLNPIENKE